MAASACLVFCVGGCFCWKGTEAFCLPCQTVDGSPFAPTLPLRSRNERLILSIRLSAGMPTLDWALSSKAPVSLILAPVLAAACLGLGLGLGLGVGVRGRG